MALANRTWQQIRTSIGYNLRAYRSIEADGAGTATTFLTDDLSLGGSQEHLGGWIVFTSGTNNDGLIRRITASDIETANNRQTITFHPAVTDATSSGDTAELWGEKYNPTAILDLGNQALMDAYSAVYDPVEDITLHGGGRQRWDIPTGLSMLKRVELRTSMDSKQVITQGIAWDESVDSDFTVASDDEDLLYGQIATRFTIAGTVSSGNIASEDVSSLDLSGYTHIEFPIKVLTAVASNDLRLRLSASASGAATTEEITIPAISALTDTWVRVAMTNPGAATAIISVALEYNANVGANTVWLGEIVATHNDSYDWTTVPLRLWKIDKEARDLVTTVELGYFLIKLVGGDEPALFTGDSSVNEIDDQYVVAQTVALALDSVGGGSSDDEKALAARSLIWYARADRRRRAFPFLTGVRKIE